MIDYAVAIGTPPRTLQFGTPAHTKHPQADMFIWGPGGRAGAEPAITTTETSSPDEFADLVEYCYGNATTKMGALRIADKHPDPYKLRFIELGNGQ